MENQNQTENFSLTKINDMNLTQVEGIASARAYIDKYFIPLDDGTHAILKNGKYQIVETSVLKSIYFNRMSKKLYTYYFTEKIDIRTIIYDVHKPVLTATELNLCPRMKHTYSPYKDFNEDTKKRVEIMLFHVKDVLCDGNNEIYQFLLKWFANMARGNKNDSCVYLKGPQGGGKSTVFEFLRHHVVGDELCVETGSGPLKTKFNSELSGKLLVIFEELENFSSAEWVSISSVLKRIITSKTIMIEAKGVDPVQHTNLNNYALASNNDAITDDDGRRYFIVPMSAKRIGDSAYFTNMHTQCFNDLVGQAFYCFLHEIDLKNYNAQQYPITDAKLDSIAKRLDSVYRFLKDDYVLKSIGINKLKLTELYKEYVSYCVRLSIQKFKGKIDFNAMLKNVGIEPLKYTGVYLYNVSYEKLKALSDKFHWVHKLDTDKCEVRTTITITKETFKVDSKVDPYEYGVEKQNLAVDTLKLKFEKLLDLNKQKNEIVKRMNQNRNLCDQYIEKERTEVTFDELREIYMF